MLKYQYRALLWIQVKLSYWISFNFIIKRISCWNCRWIMLKDQSLALLWIYVIGSVFSFIMYMWEVDHPLNTLPKRFLTETHKNRSSQTIGFNSLTSWFDRFNLLSSTNTRTLDQDNIIIWETHCRYNRKPYPTKKHDQLWYQLMLDMFKV